MKKCPKGVVGGSYNPLIMQLHELCIFRGARVVRRGKEKIPPLLKTGSVWSVADTLAQQRLLSHT